MPKRRAARRTLRRRLASGVLAAVAWARLAAGAPDDAATPPAPDGAIAGVVTDASRASPLALVLVRAVDAGGRTLAQAFTDGAGRFRLAVPAAAPCDLVLTRLGFAERRLAQLRAGSAAAGALAVSLEPAPIAVEGVTVTASRRLEQDRVAPAATSVVPREEIARRQQFTPVDAARDVEGVDFASKGLMQHTFAVRGHRGAMSNTMLMLVDHRYAGLPVLGFNLPYLIPAADEDVERIEIVRGPAAALYGPDCAQGVLHVITRSPFASTGTTLSLAAGQRSVTQAVARHAALVGDRLAFKLSAQWLRGEDWPATDPVEIANREAALAAGDTVLAERIGRRDRYLERSTGEGRLDWLAGPRTTVVLAAGSARTSNVDLANTVGAVQAVGWRNSYLQARVEHAGWQGDVFWNATDSGDTYALRTGMPIVDQSRVLVAQARRETQPGGRLRLTHGLDVRRSDPRTGGTLHGRNEDNDTMTEIGGYASGTSTLSAAWDAVAALRVDYHDRINDLAVSPRLGAVFHPRAEHAVRLTWNRAFNSPTANDLFMDYLAGGVMPGMDIRLRGIPRDGIRFLRDDGQLLMRSPLAEGGPEQLLAADATLVWQGFATLLQQQLATVRPDLVPLVADVPAPGAADVGTDLRILDPRTGAFLPVPGQVADIGADQRVTTGTFEIGYKGKLGERLHASLDVYRSRVTDFFGETYAVTPSVFLAGDDLRAYFEQQFIAAGMDPAEAAQAAAEVAAVAGAIPVGTAAHAGDPSADILLANRQGGAYTIWGVDLAMTLRLDHRLTLGASWSWISDNVVGERPDAAAMYLSVPRNKGSLAVQYADEERGLDGSLRVRAVARFPVVSGVFAQEVPGYAVVDLALGARLPLAREFRIELGALNLLDRRHQEFAGAPKLGRLATLRSRVAF